MGITSDLRILYRLAFTRVKAADHADRLDEFYRHQSGDYDDFRRRLLHGRDEMMRGLALPENGRLLDMGGGTASNLECIADRVPALASVEIVDLCAPLLKVARERIAVHGWSNVHATEGDATSYRPEAPVDAVTFSYSLTMIPDWFKAIDNAFNLLKPGGTIGVADFYVSRKWPADGLRGHSRWQRSFWPRWFAQDNVFLSPDHLPYLQSRFRTVQLVEGFGKVPYFLGLKAPYYVFLGSKP